MAAFRQNVFEVITMSTVMPFLWLTSVYRCFYCKEDFQEPDDLKKHQMVHTNNAEKWAALKNHREPTVYVDVSNISCRLCPISVKNIHKLIKHLIDDHDMPFNMEIATCMSAFKLKQFTVQCVSCQKDFTTFASLLNHTAKHHGVDMGFLCELCGQRFKSRYFLKNHRYREHSFLQFLHSQSFSCTICGENVHDILGMRLHMEKYHDQRCPGAYESLFKRTSHLVSVQKERGEVSVRDTHMQEKNNVCNVKNLILKHSAKRIVKCPLCNKAYKTKKRMEQHFIKMHQKAELLKIVVDEVTVEVDCSVKT